MRLSNSLKKEYENILINKGEDYFYKYAVGSGFVQRTQNAHSEMTILDMSEAFFSLFRQTGNDNYFCIGKLLRRAAHRLFRDKNRDQQTPESSARFLHSVR